MQGRPAIILASLCAAGLMLMAVAVSAADDPSIRGTLRPQIWETIDDYLVTQMPDGTMRLYDPIENRVLRLEITALPERVVRNGDFYVGSANCVDQDGRKIDVDFLVLQTEKPMQVMQAIVHKIDGVERRINLLEIGGTSM